MKQPMRHNWTAYAAVAALAVAGLEGCQATHAGDANAKATPVVPACPQPDLASISAALELRQTLPAGGPARQAELFQATKEAAALSPTTSNKLKFALALATP